MHQEVRGVAVDETLRKKILIKKSDMVGPILNVIENLYVNYLRCSL